VVTAIYFPVMNGGQFINFDDNTHVFLNSFVCNNNLKAVWDIFLTADTANKTYVPMTVTTFFYEKLLFGFQPSLSHFINVVLHLLVSFLAFSFARYAGLNARSAFLAVLLFAVHPIHVEAVAWITARKDLLFSAFYLMSMISYCQYQDNGKVRHYVFALVAAGLSVLSKPMALSLPLTLCLLDMLRSRRFTWLLVFDKIPFFLVVEPVAFVTYIMNARGVHFSWSTSPLIWVWSASFYLEKFCWPQHLSLIYGYPSRLVFWYPDICRGLITLFLFLLLFIKNFHWKLFRFAALFYIATVFFLWRMDVYDLTAVADRFMYLPSLCFCFVIGVMIDRALVLSNRIAIFVSLALVVLCSVLSFQRVYDWKDSFSIWNATARVNASTFAFDMKGQSLYADDYFLPSRSSFIEFVARIQETSSVKMRKVFGSSFDFKIEAARKVAALRSFQFALAQEPFNAELYEDAGLAYASFKQFVKALKCFDKRLEMSKVPSVSFYYNWGVIYQELHQDNVAMEKYNMAIRIDPNYNLPYINRAQLWLNKRQPMRALADALTAVEKDPTFPKAIEMALIIARGLEYKDLECNLLKARNSFQASTNSVNAINYFFRRYSFVK
ncbi:MAG: tetratricopeptide repeat protein, partial [Candidatus Omnitrophica bacterium]|nr:tetratricopeptide repeat protein [Candidatus Omnitrophota bacterium]